uniref:Putative secreted protein n=1 Tax=Psorophora albipes TaxID=869069 RepID=T1D5J1_9DIPT
MIGQSVLLISLCGCCVRLLLRGCYGYNFVTTYSSTLCLCCWASTTLSVTDISFVELTNCFSLYFYFDVRLRLFFALQISTVKIARPFFFFRCFQLFFFFET